MDSQYKFVGKREKWLWKCERVCTICWKMVRKRKWLINMSYKSVIVTTLKREREKKMNKISLSTPFACRLKRSIESSTFSFWEWWSVKLMSFSSRTIKRTKLKSNGCFGGEEEKKAAKKQIEKVEKKQNQKPSKDENWNFTILIYYHHYSQYILWGHQNIFIKIKLRDRQYLCFLTCHFYHRYYYYFCWFCHCLGLCAVHVSKVFGFFIIFTMEKAKKTGNRANEGVEWRQNKKLKWSGGKI